MKWKEIWDLRFQFQKDTSNTIEYAPALICNTSLDTHKHWTSQCTIKYKKIRTNLVQLPILKTHSAHFLIKMNFNCSSYY